ncbi:MAG: glycogen/starch/alpha-glucan phosphorylase, partial [Erysipelotrichaceae bacterium]|nr:glycogen/starch/alpha-glucan phosphorylase [Erysipelotrichaceae bacterium]
MFTTKEEFKRQFQDRFVQTYGRSYKYGDSSETFLTLGEMIRDQASENWMSTKETVSGRGQKQLFYFSMEFLIGRLLTNNLMNMGIYEIVRDGLADLGLDLNELEEVETDAGLGNGGLGRLAACFLDSLATLGLPGHGNTIRYEYGLFKQKIENNKQVEVPDIWLKYGNPWEV